MIFCPKCGSILRPKEKAGKKILWCNCGFAKDLEEEKKEQAESQEQIKEQRAEEPKPELQSKKLEIVEKIETHPKVKADCEKCGNKEAYYWTQQTRAADEPETRFFKCTDCEHTWREYS